MGNKFNTGNSTVAGLGVGAILRVSGPGELEVLDGGGSAEGDGFFGEEVETFEVGDIVEVDGHGEGTVVKLTSQVDRLLAAARGETNDVIYLTHDDQVVRSAPRSKVSF